MGRDQQAIEGEWRNRNVAWRWGDLPVNVSEFSGGLLGG